MGFNTIDINGLNTPAAILGGFLSLFGLSAVLVKKKWYLGEAFPAVAVGILFGPVSANFLNASEWALPAAIHQKDEIALGVMRVMIGIQLEILVCLLPVMAIMWLATSACIAATIPRISLLSALAIGACLTPTDPILSQAVAKGPFADQYVARPLREIISAEAGANDGFASPFLMLAINLLRNVYGEGTVGAALRDWVVGTLLYIVALGMVYGAVVGLCAQAAVRFALRRQWVDTEGYLLFPTALGLFVLGTCGAIGASDLLACFVAGCVLNWDGEFLAETQRRHDEVNSSIDAILNMGGFMYVGIMIPWDEFHQPETTGITWARLLGLGLMVLVFRRLPAILVTYRMMPHAVRSWREALFMGYFGPIGVGAVFYLEHTLHMFYAALDFSDEDDKLKAAINPVVYFLVLFSIVVHGASTPILSLIYRLRGATTIKEDAVEYSKRSDAVATPPNAIEADNGTIIAFNRFARPAHRAASLPAIVNTPMAAATAPSIAVSTQKPSRVVFKKTCFNDNDHKTVARGHRGW